MSNFRLFSAQNVLELPERVKPLDVASFPNVMKRAQLGIEKDNSVVKIKTKVTNLFLRSLLLSLLLLPLYFTWLFSRLL